MTTLLSRIKEALAKICDDIKDELLEQARIAAENGNVILGYRQLTAERCALAIRAASLPEIEREIAEMERDAKRYRWLRQWHWLGNGVLMERWPEGGPNTPYPTFQAACDAAIDTALAREAGRG